ncbi:AbiTii domain-containing protein [Bacillus andreraoultii]|nr:hypothetical protein [Bacillus andreraoultii]
MDSIVLDLQKEAMDSGSSISNLLRKSYVISKKLKIRDFEKWASQELNGYMSNLENIPDYREVRGSLQFLNPIYGWRPVIIENPELADIVSTNKISQPITEIEYLVESSNDHLVIQLPQNIQNQLSNWADGRPTKFQVSFGKSQAQQIIDSVRNIILEWSIQLEEDGILGEGVSFSKEEKREADKQNYTVNNFYGNTSGVQIQQHTQHSIQTQINEMDLEKVNEFISMLRGNLSHITLEREVKEALELEISKISNELMTNKPKTQIIKESMRTIKSVLEGITGSLIASGLLHEISKITV